MSDPISGDWIVLTNVQTPIERITMQAGSEKYALIFSDTAVAQDFLQDLQDESLVLETLTGWVLKDTYLLTLQMIGVTRVVFDYQKGKHNVLSAPLGALQERIKHK
ncbi:MAG: DUF3234 domain-containing protein [Deinococcales bacterium]